MSELKCTSTKERLSLANIWLEEIKKIYNEPDKLVELYTESFLITCKSIADYVIMDYLIQNFPKMTINRKSYIIQMKSRIMKGKERLRDDEKGIVEFLNAYNEKYKDFESIPLVAYFITLRNLLVHSVFPHLFENQYEGSGPNQKVVQRKFQRDFTNYLLTDDGNGLLLENGYHLLLENNGNESFSDLKPLSKVSKEEQTKLYDKFDLDSPLELMAEYLIHLLWFIQKFE